MLQAKREIIDSNFTPYLPEVLPAAKPVFHPISAEGKRQSMLTKIAAKRRVERRTRIQNDANILIASFIEECNNDKEQHGSSSTEDAENELFWNQLEGNSQRDEVFHRIESPSRRMTSHAKGCKPSRISRLFS